MVLRSDCTSNCSSSSKEVLSIKTEPIDDYEECAEEDSDFPLDVQISEPEENSGENEKSDIECEELSGLPVKTELIECKEECQALDDENNTNPFIKAEPLEEGYEDRVNDFIQIVTKEKLPVQIFTSDDTVTNCSEENEAESGHFLSQIKPKRLRGGMLQCAKCLAKFKYKSTYDYHVKSACGTKMIARDHLVKKSGKKNQFDCNVCHKRLSSRTSLMVHMRIHTGERPFACDICSRSFYQKAHLKDHINSHLSGKPMSPLYYTCAECGNVYPTKSQLTSHMNVHFGDRVFGCNVCHKRFRTRSNLSNHKMIHSGRKPHCCTVCGKDFLRKPSLDDHMRIHTQEKPFECEICGKRFAEKTRRNTHVKRHTGELTQVCPTCGKKFAGSYDLRVHQRMHTGEKPFSCNICGRMFNRKSIMETHMTIHTGRKDFVCTECGEAFNRKSKLDIHLTTHTGEKFFCEICHRVFKCKAYLVPHIRTHFGISRMRGKTCKCLLCRQEFPNHQLLQDHLAKTHPTLFQPPSPASAPPPITFVKVESDQ
ncbi:zinc finger protein OZF-like [Macrosteles quadrilineatus]|uniref:zinc finger protein OZF-like n=1 Tax=Macrosteles quadrilineatus TaxID=74068 RepID=UPI0023E09F20|nr:zinc finger protein OZF-like [Macrosteles quadrilineatus]